VSSGGLVKKLSGGVNDKLVYPETCASTPAASSTSKTPPSAPLAEAEGSEDDSFDGDDGSQELSLGDLPGSDSNSSGVPSLGQFFVFDSRSRHSASVNGSQDQESDHFNDNVNEDSAPSDLSSEADEFSVRVKVTNYFQW
jgi:hypothetical protein